MPKTLKNKSQKYKKPLKGGSCNCRSFFGGKKIKGGNSKCPVCNCNCRSCKSNCRSCGCKKYKKTNRRRKTSKRPKLMKGGNVMNVLLGNDLASKNVISAGYSIQGASTTANTALGSMNSHYTGTNIASNVVV